MTSVSVRCQDGLGTTGFVAWRGSTIAMRKALCAIEGMTDNESEYGIGTTSL